jgi:adenine-specific DNA-methyltransferase
MADNYDDYTKDQLVRLLRERDRRPRFGLVWERDEIDHDLSVNNDFVALDWDANLSCGESAKDNLIIEGDNFDALRYLRMTHAGRVKCIYIDPPYNTGNRDFIYNDRFVDKDDAYRHSKWLEFLYRRLELAKELLTEDGVIFVSIDDNEVFHLGLLMEQVFGAANFVANVIWQKVDSPKNTAQHFSDDHEYIICCALNKATWRPNRVPRTEAMNARYKNPDNDPRGPWLLSDLAARNPYSLGIYPITTPSGRVIEGPPAGSYWRVSEEKLRQLDADNRVWWGKDGNNRPGVKRFLTEVRDGVVPQTLWKWESVGSTRHSKQELSDILAAESGYELFVTPKPVTLMERILRIATNPGDIVLDFFAGSGTTAQAVLNLNKEDGGKRRFILVSSTEATADAPDKNLCRDVCAERVRRVISGYTNKKGLAIDGLGGGFAYLRCRRIPAATVFRSIQHDQVWTALQLIHDVALTPYQAKLPMQTTESKRGLVIYLPKLTDSVLDTVESAIHSAGQAVVYSWQPALLAQRLTDPRVAFEPIPAFLVNRFGARSSSATGGRP